MKLEWTGPTGVKDKRFLWKKINFNLLIPTWHHSMGFKEIVTIDAVLMQLEISERRARRVVAMHYYPNTVSPL